MWIYDRDVPVLTLRGTSTPLIYERFAIAGFGNGRVVALDIDNGSVRWEARVAIAQGRSEIDRIVDDLRNRRGWRSLPPVETGSIASAVMADRAGPGPM